MKKIKFSKCDDVIYITDGGWLFQWCCDCHLRHIWKIDIVKDKKTKKQFIKMEGVDDRKATELRKWYEKRRQYGNKSRITKTLRRSNPEKVTRRKQML